MFGIGLPELAVIAFFGVILMGPDKLPGLAKQLGQGIKAAKRMGDSVRDDLRTSLGDDYADLELRDLNPREMVRRQVMEVLAERDEDESDSDDEDDDTYNTDDEDDADEPAGATDALPAGAVHPLRDERKTA
ncbi:twin-arginine translocase TatA/TatE family subunit [Nocardioides hwasunensis]|uniref:Twin-arginine translocase TatA/TatE family subunit n=1 Tax=Nocardioides hwasunensis TaxID=397258 RepID=A0ABR8MFL6_9ACTN|nr:twin-arginine translocase TatA/TatE family subunit [Nocardioides hwasunensis]MBD3914876.1 twin-arginine translocase TatA/TatE family subunit [Nocardioides hwasunensis]